MQNTNDPAGFNPARPKELGADYGRGNFSSSSNPAGQAASSDQNLGDQVMSAGRDISGRVRETASATADAVRSHAADLASEGRDTIMEKAQDQKQAGAEYISGLAESIRRAAREFDKEIPFAANYIRTAAAGVDNVADTVRDGNFSDLMTQTQNFARRQPTLFVGLSMLAGFGVARLLKGTAAPMMSAGGQSAPTRSPASDDPARGAGSADADGIGRRTSGGSARQSVGDEHGLGM